MLGFIAKFGSSKGMVAVPNLNGLNRGQAIAAIQSAGLVFGGNSPVETSNSSLNDLVQSQPTPAGTLVDYESSFSFGYYVYVAPAIVVTYDACEDTTPVIVLPAGCSGCNRITTRTTPQRQAKRENGVIVDYVACASITTSTITFSDASCPGCAPPAPSCTPSESWNGPWSSCQSIGAGGGVQYRYKTITRSNCTSYVQEFTQNCCSNYCGSWSTWAGGGGAQSRSRTCQRSDCTTYTESQTRCSPQSSTSCGPCSRKAPFRRSCTTTTLNSDCSSPPSRTYSEAC